MKTWICEQPNRLVLRDTERPAIQAGQAMIRVRRIGICGTDLHAYKGRQPYFTYPRILGHELSGTIEAIDAPSSTFNIGDPVVVIPYLECGSCAACRKGKTNCCAKLEVLGVHRDGGMREYMTVPADHLLSAEGLTLDQAAIVECLAIGAHAVRRAALQPDDTVLVIGAGPIGLGVMKFAKLAGARTIALDLQPSRLQYSRRWAEVDEIVDGSQHPLEQIAAITGGDMPEVVFDATGSARSMIESFGYTAHGGKLVFVGLVNDDIVFRDPDFHKKELTLLGSRNAARIDFEQVIQAMRDGQLETDLFITHRLEFAELGDRYEMLYEPDEGVIKAVVSLGK